MRHCGECTACCEGWLSSEVVNMKPGVPCQHRTDSGCAIYENRPAKPCKQFRCAWLDAEDLDEGMRPDKSGAIARYRGWKSWKTLAIIPTGQTVPDDTLMQFLNYANGAGLPLVWSERAEDFVNDTALTRKALGPEEFMLQVKWDFSDQDIFWDFTAES